MFVRTVAMLAILAIWTRSEQVDTTGKGRKRTVEFLESIKGQSYLEYISYKDRFVLDLYALDKTLKTSDIIGEQKKRRRMSEANIRFSGHLFAAKSRAS